MGYAGLVLGHISIRNTTRRARSPILGAGDRLNSILSTMLRIEESGDSSNRNLKALTKAVRSETQPTNVCRVFRPSVSSLGSHPCLNLEECMHFFAERHFFPTWDQIPRNEPLGTCTHGRVMAETAELNHAELWVRVSSRTAAFSCVLIE